MTLLGLSILKPRPAKTDWGCGAGADRILSVDCLGWIRSPCLEDIGWALDGLVEVGATVRADRVLAEAGRTGAMVESELIIEEGRRESGIASTFPRLLPSCTSLLARPPLSCTASSMGFKEATEADVLKCRFELL